MHAGRCNPLEKQQHLITVSSGLRRVQHCSMHANPALGAPGPSSHLHLSSASSRAVGCNGAFAGILRRSSSRSPCDFPSRHPAAELCSSPLRSIRLTHSALMLAGLALKHTLLLSARPPLVPYTLRFTS